MLIVFIMQLIMRQSKIKSTNAAGNVRQSFQDIYENGMKLGKQLIDRLFAGQLGRQKLKERFVLAEFCGQ